MIRQIPQRRVADPAGVALKVGQARKLAVGRDITRRGIGDFVTVAVEVALLADVFESELPGWEAGYEVAAVHETMRFDPPE